MTSKVSIDGQAISSRIQKALAGAASALATALENATSDLPVEISHKTDGNSHEFTAIGIGELTASQIHDGAVSKSGQRLPAKPFMSNALAEVDLSKEFQKGF
jgi:hypothetical protein